MQTETTHAGVRFPPPLTFLGLLLVGLAAEWLVRDLSFGLERRLLIALGALLFAAGLFPAVAALGLFRRAGTRPEPWQPTSAIVTTGIYGRTRNPMYLGMALAFAGLAVALDAPLALALLPVALLVIRTTVIAREERYLEARFGREYLDYRARVRRWL